MTNYSLFTRQQTCTRNIIDSDSDDDIIFLLEELQAPGIDGCVVSEAW